MAVNQLKKDLANLVRTEMSLANETKEVKS